MDCASELAGLPFEEAEREDHQKHQQNHDAPAIMFRQDRGCMPGRQPCQCPLPNVRQQRKVAYHSPKQQQDQCNLSEHLQQQTPMLPTSCPELKDSDDG